MAVHNATLLDWVEHIPVSPRIAIITAEFNPEITHWLLEKTRDTILEHRPEAIVDEFFVPGALELAGMASMILEKDYYQSIVLLGCVLKWSTPHFDYVCDSVTQGFTLLSTSYSVPMIFGVLTVDTLAQAQERVIDSYGIYTLNYLAQWMYADSRSDERNEEILEQAKELLENLDMSQLGSDE